MGTESPTNPHRHLKHTGHADVLREAVDGLRGNDPD
jgi:hypothetical protein